MCTAHRCWCVLVASIVAGGCVERVTLPPTIGVDAGGPTDPADAGAADSAAHVVPPAPGSLALVVEAARWSNDSSGRPSFRADVRLANGAASDPLPLRHELFSARTVGGLEVGAAELRGDLCERRDTSIAAEGSVSCTLQFLLPNDQLPLELIYRAPDDREARGAVAACSPSAVDGLCEPGLVCDHGLCGEPCSFGGAVGACADEEAICFRGACRHPCSPEHPDGACEVGGCRDGACDASCTGTDLLSDEACTICFHETFEVESPPACFLPVRSCANLANCLSCPDAEVYNTCTCPENAWCDGCDASAIYDCLLAHCPACRN